MKNLKKSILILSSLIIMVLCSACSKANNYSMSDFVGVYYGENGSVLTLLSNGTSNYYFVSSDNIETGSPWNYDDKKLTWHYQGGNLDVYAKISKDNNKMVFKSNNPLFWDNDEYVKISDEDKVLTYEECYDIVDKHNHTLAEQNKDLLEKHSIPKIEVSNMISEEIEEENESQIDTMEIEFDGLKYYAPNILTAANDGSFSKTYKDKEERNGIQFDIIDETVDISDKKVETELLKMLEEKISNMGSIDIGARKVEIDGNPAYLCGGVTIEAGANFYVDAAFIVNQETDNISYVVAIFEDKLSRDIFNTSFSGDIPSTDINLSGMQEKERGGSVTNSDVIAMLDEYEAFMNEYIDFMKKYSNGSGDTISMLGDYATMLEKYADYEEKINAIDESKLTSEELAYYTKVTGRVLEKMSEIY